MGPSATQTSNAEHVGTARKKKKSYKMLIIKFMIVFGHASVSGLPQLKGDIVLCLRAGGSRPFQNFPVLAGGS